MERVHQKIGRIKELLTKYLEERREVVAAYLYGSIVDGKDTTDSDVDIALLTIPFKDKMESGKAGISYQTEISSLLKKEVDIVFLQEAGELLSFQILRKGQVIFEADEEMHRSFRAYRLIKCLDFQFIEKRMGSGMINAMRGSSIG